MCLFLFNYFIPKYFFINIDQLESLSGIDFFCNLPDDVEEKVESLSTEQIKNDWGLE